jgi:magnesium transporter
MFPRSTPSRPPLQVIIEGSTSLRTLVSPSRGSALVLVELGCAAFFAAGIAQRAIGDLAPIFLFGAVIVGAVLRAVDLESTALFVPGGLYGMTAQAFSRRVARVAAAALLVEHALLAALAASVAGHLLAALIGFIPQAFGSSRITVEDLSMTLAVGLIGAVWLWMRSGRPLPTSLVIRTVLAGVASVGVLVVTGLMAAGGRHAIADWVASVSHVRPTWRELLAAAGACVFAVGSSEALGRAAADFPQPKIQHLRRTARFVNILSLLTALTGLLFVWLVPESARTAWHDASLAGIAVFVQPGAWGRLLSALVVFAATGFLSLTVFRSVDGARHTLFRLSEEGILSQGMRVLHPRLGTPTRLVDLSALGALAVLIAGAGQLTWLANAFAVALICGALLKIAALVRFRRLRPEARAFRVPVNVRFGSREWPVGLAVAAVLAGVPALMLLASGNPAALAGVGLLVTVAVLLKGSQEATRWTGAAGPVPSHEMELLSAPAIGFDGIQVKPGNVLVPVRYPGFLTHLVGALQSAGDRDVVAMTVRIVGVDVSDDRLLDSHPTEDERRLLTAAAMLAERYGRAIRLLIVPGSNVFDAVVETIVRLRSTDVYVGESRTLSADDQARLVGEAWERAAHHEALDVRLVVHHSSGRTAVYHLGAHTPSLNSDDLYLIHSLWLDATRAIGPRLHHRDIVRAALTHMQEELNTEGPPRDATLDLIRRTAHPADELAAVVHARDFARLRDMVRNRPASDVAAMLTDLTVEDQVVTFRVLPRKLAAATFEYLSPDAQQTLLKAMAQDDVAALLNDMAPDDRTMFLEELPAAATQRLLSLLKPEERAVAVTLLGYPEHSIGRLMTPDYVSVREHWTVQAVLDHIRTHGQDSETLNIIYVVDDHGVLVDDIHIREFLLTSTASRVSDLMDRRFVALNASDDQNTAVTVFRKEDRSALPVTDSTGVLIGIVTIDDVLDVAEAAATKEIQKIGGSEALDEPYMQIAFVSMIKKRAGWLTALFLGEMLTATAMGAFEHEIERAVVLALFVPLIISSGGNSGSQASTLVIRAIALGEVQLRDWWRVMQREVYAGLALGGILGTIGFLRITIWSLFSTLYGEHWFLVALTVGMALVGVVLWGTLVGSLLPFILRRLGFDPATSSAPFVATLVDVTGLIIYFSVGLVVLRGTLL